jgi:hypothetical protein
MWLGNTSHTKSLRITEQYRRIDDSGRHAAKSWMTAHPETIAEANASAKETNASILM